MPELQAYDANGNPVQGATKSVAYDPSGYQAGSVASKANSRVQAAKAAPQSGPGVIQKFLQGMGVPTSVEEFMSAIQSGGPGGAIGPDIQRGEYGQAASDFFRATTPILPSVADTYVNALTGNTAGAFGSAAGTALQAAPIASGIAHGAPVGIPNISPEMQSSPTLGRFNPLRLVPKVGRVADAFDSLTGGTQRVQPKITGYTMYNSPAGPPKPAPVADPGLTPFPEPTNTPVQPAQGPPSQPTSSLPNPIRPDVLASMKETVRVAKSLGADTSGMEARIAAYENGPSNPTGSTPTPTQSPRIPLSAKRPMEPLNNPEDVLAQSYGIQAGVRPAPVETGSTPFPQPTITGELPAPSAGGSAPLNDPAKFLQPAPPEVYSGPPIQNGAAIGNAPRQTAAGPTGQLTRANQVRNLNQISGPEDMAARFEPGDQSPAVTQGITPPLSQSQMGNVLQQTGPMDQAQNFANRAFAEPPEPGSGIPTIGFTPEAMQDLLARLMTRLTPEEIDRIRNNPDWLPSTAEEVTAVGPVKMRQIQAKMREGNAAKGDDYARKVMENFNKGPQNANSPATTKTPKSPKR